MLAGSGIGGEYAAINSAIDELIPARVRGRVALAINGSWWIGTAIAAGASYPMLHYLAKDVGWRLGFAIGAILALGIIVLRRGIPESPRWLLTHGRHEEAEEVVREIEARVEAETGELPEPEDKPMEVDQREHIGFVSIARYVVKNYPGRGVLGLSTICWSAIFFFASAGASAAYLTVSELFPMEARAMAIALFYSAGTGCAIGAPYLFGSLIGSGSRTHVFWGYLLGAGLMIAAGLVAVALAVNAERRSLEDIARPLTVRRREAAAAASA